MKKYGSIKAIFTDIYENDAEDRLYYHNKLKKAKIYYENLLL